VLDQITYSIRLGALFGQFRDLVWRKKSGIANEKETIARKEKKGSQRDPKKKIYSQGTCGEEGCQVWETTKKGTPGKSDVNWIGKFFQY